MKIHIVSYKIENKKIPHCKNSSKHQSKIAEISKMLSLTHIFSSHGTVTSIKKMVQLKVVLSAQTFPLSNMMWWCKCLPHVMKWLLFTHTMKSLKIPKGQSESVYRRTDNTMANRKSRKGQTTIYKTYT
jgi:hypothetical protein